MRAKRVLDVAVSLVALMALAPLFAVVAWAIRREDSREVFYHQVRMGKDGVPFTIWKFRTIGYEVGEGTDEGEFSRLEHITPVGRFLRRWKLDELPQFYNVLRGEMSLVGPRPEITRNVELYSEEFKRILAVKPGMTGPTAIRFRREQELIQDEKNMDQFYRDTILPMKIQSDLRYLEERSLIYDVYILFKSICAVLFK